MSPVEKLNMRKGWVTLAVTAIVYAGIAGAITLFADEDKRTFFWIIGALVAVRFFYTIIEFFNGILVWRIYGRRKAVEGYVTAMREAKMPRRCYNNDGVGNYLCRIQDGDSYKAGEVSPEAVSTAAKINELITRFSDENEMMAEARAWDALERAFNIYTSDDSPPLTFLNLHWFQNKVTEEMLLKMPYMTPPLASSLFKDRPFDSIHDLWDYLRNRGLDKDMASGFFIVASYHSKEEAVPDDVVKNMAFLDQHRANKHAPV